MNDKMDNNLVSKTQPGNERVSLWNKHLFFFRHRCVTLLLV